MKQDYLRAKDTPENAEECLCPTCPSYPHGCRGEVLYCARGVSRCTVHAAGCLCPDCPVWKRYELVGDYFCDRMPMGLSGEVMRKGGLEPTGFREEVAAIKDEANMGRSLPCAMGTFREYPFSLGDLFFLPAQLSRFPLNEDEPVDTSVTIGPRAGRPLVLPTPIIIAGMSFGAVAKNVRLSIAQGARDHRFGFNTGEGGILPEELDLAADRMIAQYSTGRFGVPEDRLKRASAVEVRFGQGAYPGKGSVLPGSKVTREVAEVRGTREGYDSLSPARHPDISSPSQVKEKVSHLRQLTGGAPIGAKIACGRVEGDLRVLVDAGVDFVALDGFGGGTGATELFARENAGLPIVAALPRAVRYLEERGVREHITVIASGGLRTSGDFAKCLALGADAVYIGTAALIAINCQQYRVCYTNKCPTGVTTQDPALIAKVDPLEGAKRLGNFVKVCTEEMAGLARVAGRLSVGELDRTDLVSVDQGTAALTGVHWVGDRGP